MKRNGKYICNRCGCKIDTANDLDCMEVKAFQFKSISEIEPSVEMRSLIDVDDYGSRNKFFRVSDATKYHYCGKCMNKLMQYVYSYEFKKPPITEEVVRCGDCERYLTSSCPMSYIEKKTLQFVDMRNDFFCGYGERKSKDDKRGTT